MKSQFENAKRVLEGILNREWLLRDSAPNEYKLQLRRRYPEVTEAEIDEKTGWFKPFFVRKDAPGLRTCGTHQLILGLDHGYVGKSRLKGETDNHYVLHAGPVYEPCLVDTLKILSEIGFCVQEHHYVGLENKGGNFKVKDNGLEFVIACDLTENGRYRVEDVNDEHFQTLSNGAELKKQLIDALITLQRIHDDKSLLYGIVVNDHVTDEGPPEAFRHMFFTQIDQNTNTGRLVLGDLDHVILYRKHRTHLK